MTKVSSTTDLPKWFDLERYRASEDFTAEHWLEQLDRRINLLPENHNSPDINQQPNDREQQRVADEIWWAMVSKKLTAVREEPTVCRFACKGVLIPGMPVRSVTCFDLVMQSHRDEIAIRRGLRKPSTVNRWAAIGDPNYPTKSAIEASFQRIEIDFYLPGGSPQPVVRVDLGATDATLKEAFSMWLTEARSRQPVDASKPGKQLYDRWARYGILPYLDLWMWGKEVGAQIIEGVYAAAIFPGQEDGKDRLKTTKKWVKSLMRDLSALQAVAAIEAQTYAGPEITEGKKFPEAFDR